MAQEPSKALRLAISVLTCLVFLGLICLPPAAQVLHITPNVPLQENDVNPMPTMHADFDTLSQVIYKLRRNWLEKNFGLRKLLVRWESIMNVLVLHSCTAFDAVVAGRKNWLYLAEENPNLNVINDYRVITPLTSDQLGVWTQIFKERQDWLEANGIKYMLVIAPNKCSIYPEYLPKQFNRVRQRGKLDQMVEALQGAGLDVLDLRPALLKAKDHLKLYYRTDTHWTPHGAFLAYQAMMARLKAYFPEFQAAQSDDFTIISEPNLLGGLSYMLALGDLFPESRITYTPKKPHTAREVTGTDVPLNYFQPLAVYETKDPSLPRAVIFRDSFIHEIIPFLSEHFSRSVYVWPYPTDAVQTRAFDKKMILQEKPDIVIEEFVERYFTQPPPVHALAPEE
jgi:hypothetical protein